MGALRTTIVVLDVIVVAYMALYVVSNLVLLIISARVTRDTLRRERHQELEEDERRSFAPLVSLIVPAYNEEVTIVETIRSLLALRYPRFEIVIVNDGSKDDTIGVLKEAFKMTRGDVEYDAQLGSQPVRAFYRGSTELPASVDRLLLVDKENGGKADAINAGINAARGAYVTTMDADSLIVDLALHRAVQPMLDDPNRIFATGGQIGLSNGSRIEDGAVVELGLPKRWIARIQIVEYLRSFSQSRAALGELNGLLILSGVFAVFQREALVAAGGFLSEHMRSRVGTEYCGEGSVTVCEDMEVVVRLHRYARDRGLEGRVVLLPTIAAWTEAPEVWRDLGKQRSRWYRGLLEVLWLHRGAMLRPRYGRIGLFSLPYQLIFEALAPILETLGYIVLPLSWAAGLLDWRALLTFGGFALAWNSLLSFLSTLLGVRRVRLHDKGPSRALIDYRKPHVIAVLALSGLISNFGYRQYLLAWQLKGLVDFLRGRRSWDKFARKGFKPPSK